jgi:hypothetical protein
MPKMKIQGGESMKIFKIACLTALLVTMIACASTPDYDAWLETHNSAPEINVSGKWNAGLSMAGGWGSAELIQQGRYVYGTLGLYSVKGVVSNTSLFLKIYSSGYVYYTAKLNKNDDGSLSGMATREAIVESPAATNADISMITMTRK